MVKCAIGTDHRGYVLKQSLLVSKNIEWIDAGAYSKERSDFPVFARHPKNQDSHNDLPHH